MEHRLQKNSLPLKRESILPSETNKIGSKFKDKDIIVQELFSLPISSSNICYH